MKFIFICIFFSVGSASAVETPLRVVTESLPPYQVVENGKLVGGSSFILMQETLKRVGYTGEIEVLPWARAYQIALTDDNVIIFSIVRSPEREPLFKWIGQLNQKSYSFYSAISNQKVNIRSVEEALKYIAVTVRGSFEEGVLKRLGFATDDNLILTVDYIDAANIVQIGRADVILSTPVVEFSYELEKNVNSFRKQPYIVATRGLYVAASKNTSEEIILKLSDALSEVKNDSTFIQMISEDEKPSIGAVQP